MSLHVPTMFVALLLAFALFSVALTFARPFLRDRAELRLWGWGTWILVAGFVVLSSRAFLPEWIAVLCGNGLVFVGLFLFSRALHRFVLQQDAPRWQAGLMIASWACTALILSWPLYLRTSIISTLVAAQLTPLVWLLARQGWHAEASLRTVAVTLGLTVVALVVRAAHAQLRPDEYSGFFQASLGNGLTYLASFLFPLGAGFGFVLANLERVAHRLHESATHDSLTGCESRGVFDTVLPHVLERARREAAAVSLVIIDLDNFKQINDVHGHQAGDGVLRAFARAVRARLRAADVFARLGGEEFGVILPGTDAAGAMRVAEDLRTTVQALEIPVPDGGRLRVTISLGVSAAAVDRALTPEDLFAQADSALYEAKRGGRNCAVQGAATR
jgi:diguanylate cyclase (GGDEF)-like protein